MYKFPIAIIMFSTLSRSAVVVVIAW